MPSPAALILDSLKSRECHPTLSGLLPRLVHCNGYCKQPPQAYQSEQCSAPVLSYLSTVLMRAYISMSRPTLCDPTDSASPGCSVHGDSRGKNTVVGCHALLQGVFPTQRWKLCLLHLLHGNADEFFTASATWEAPTVVTVLASLSVLKLLFRCLQ